MNQQNLSFNRPCTSQQSMGKNTTQSQCDCNEIAVITCEPYPPISVERANFNYARMLYQPLAGAKSEMTVIYQYLYQSWILKQEHPKLSQLISRIAQVQMHHLQSLGELIVLLGGNPKCRTMGQCGTHNKNVLQFWSGGMVRYECNVKDILKNNCAVEEGACNTYQTLSKLIHDPCVSATLCRFAADEQLHATLFKQQSEELCN